MKVDVAALGESYSREQLTMPGSRNHRHSSAYIHSIPAYLILLLLLLSVANVTHAISRDIVSGRSICDQTETACIDGSITWLKNRKMITIEGRLKRAIEPGKLIFLFSGFLSSGEQVFHSKEIEIRGKRGEILDERFKPPYSNQTIWSLYRFTYQPTQPAD
ncbi:hypothetical protein [Alkalimarinus alittae]|uniref:DUF4131 domain-containing protein n=1 Tax=Alkalimarinus alittae TaxID=2961619 RepID=A0ABY6N2Z0_9ALTE|nr:hypothetical protein [Alkalimarinus alittae]UZE96477.1 hypothetical protein NKI27_01640 [Alkalimarinus alittae]